jgi:hypothetical protein
VQEAEAIKRFRQLESDRKPVEDTWELITKFVAPFRGEFFRQLISEAAINWRETREVFDSTAIHAANTLASAIHGVLTSDALQWFEMEYGQKKLNKDKESLAWLQDASKECHTKLQNSNFGLEVNELYLDLVSYGPATIFQNYEEENNQFKKFVFQAMPLDSSYFEEDAEGKTLNFYRHYEWTALQIAEKFPDKCPDDIKTMAGSSQDNKYGVLFVVYHRPDKRANLNSPRVLVPLERPIGCKYILLNDGHLLEEGGYHDFPVYNPKFRRTAKSKLGHSPAVIALPHILSLNRMQELTEQALAKAVDPASLVTERGILSDLDLRAGGKTVVRNKDDVTPYESAARFDASMLEREALRQQILSIFFIDKLEMKESPAMTATEVQTRYELMQRLLGPTLGRLRSDFLDPLVQSTFNTLYRYGVLGEPPAMVAQESDGNINIMYVGPLARAQKSDITQSVTRYVAGIAELSGIKEDILDNVNFDTLAVELAQLEGVPAVILNSRADVKKMRDQRAEQVQAQQEAELAAMQGQAAENMGKGAQALAQGGAEFEQDV